jgi:decaprenyl-phosphate phosphoribosyltransferase
MNCRSYLRVTKSVAASSSQLLYIKILKPKLWGKNLIVFAPPLLEFSINQESMGGSLLAFILLCLTSSSFYILSDIVDIEFDRQHSIKCQRPIAAGLISIPTALTIALFLLALGELIAWRFDPKVGIFLSIYAALQVAYNLGIKRMIILDIGFVAASFVIRAYVGAEASEVPLSPWFAVYIAMLAMFLAIEKRKAALNNLQSIESAGDDILTVTPFYSYSFLNRMECATTTITILTYGLWSSGPKLQGASTSWMLITLPFIFYGLFRYQLISEPQGFVSYRDLKLSQHPGKILFQDKGIFFTVMSWIISCLGILWLKHQGLIN